MTEAQHEIAQYWNEFARLGPTRRQQALDRRDLAIEFLAWIDGGNDEYSGLYSIEEIVSFLETKIDEWRKL